MKVLRTADVGYVKASEEAAEVLRNGGIVLYPTDTLYGLGVDALSEEALKKLYALKQRSHFKTALVAVPSSRDVGIYGQMNATATMFAERFFPGPLTLVLTAMPGIPKGIIRDDGSVGIRVPNDPFCMMLSAMFNSPYTSTSANISDAPTLPTVEEILSQFGDSVAAISLAIDDGPRAGGTPSTIVSCVADVPEILREGALTRETLGIM